MDAFSSRGRASREGLKAENAFLRFLKRPHTHSAGLVGLSRVFTSVTDGASARFSVRDAIRRKSLLVWEVPNPFRRRELGWWIHHHWPEGHGGPEKLQSSAICSMN